LGRQTPRLQAALVDVPAVDLRQYDRLLEGWSSLAAGAGVDPAGSNEAPGSPGAEAESRVVEACAPTTAGDEARSYQTQNKEAIDASGACASPGEKPAGVVSTDDTGAAGGGGPAGDGGVLELRGVSTGTGATGVPAASSEPHRAVLESVQAAAGEELGDIGPEAVAGEGGAAVAWPVERGVRGA